MIWRISCVFLLLPGLLCAGESPAPAYLLQLPPSVTSVVIAETETATLHRYTADGDTLQPVEKRHMSIGELGAGKQQRGDRRTPLGLYFIVEELDTTRLHEKYGPVAFPLDYPNAWDKRNSRTGYGIWIHGVVPGSGLRPVRDTDGCIALPNDELLSLRAHLVPFETPVIVTRRIRTASAADIAKLREQLLAAVDTWAGSVRDGDWHRFLSLYAEDFGHRGMSREEWAAYRVQSAAERPLEAFAVDELALLADPEDPALYLSRFRQTIREAGATITTTKRLYWSRNEAGEFRIVAEDSG